MFPVNMIVATSLFTFVSPTRFAPVSIICAVPLNSMLLDRFNHAQNKHDLIMIL